MYFYLFLVFIILLIFVWKKKICFLGFHDKATVGDSELKIEDYIKEQLVLKYNVSPGDSLVLANRIQEVNIIQEVRCCNLYVYDSVCIKCNKCFDYVNKEKKEQDYRILDYMDKIKKRKLRSQIANDLWNENCKKE